MQPDGGLLPLYWSSQPSPKIFSQSLAASESRGWTSRGSAPLLTLGVGTARGVGGGLCGRPGASVPPGSGDSVAKAGVSPAADGVGPTAMGPGPDGASIWARA